MIVLPADFLGVTAPDSLLTLFSHLIKHGDRYVLTFDRAELSRDSGVWAQHHFSEHGFAQRNSGARLVTIRDYEEYDCLRSADPEICRVIEEVREQAIQSLLDRMAHVIQERSGVLRRGGFSSPVRTADVLRVLRRDSNSGCSHLGIPFPFKEQPYFPPADTVHGAFVFPPVESFSLMASMLSIVGPNAQGTMLGPYHRTDTGGMAVAAHGVHGNPSLYVVAPSKVV